MNEHQTNHSEVNDTYSPETDAQSNPFNGDQMGEFTSNFGTNTNAVSQIFREGGYAQNKSKIAGVVALLLLLGGAAFFFLTGEDSAEEDFLAEESFETPLEDSEEILTEGEDLFAEADEGVIEEEVMDEGMMAEEATPAVEEAPAIEEAIATEPAMTGGTNVPMLVEPADGASRAYDETSGSANFSWEGDPGGWIVFSRSPSMTPQTMRIRVEGNNYAFNHPWPGTWYWRVDNAAGSSEVRSFSIAGAVRRNVMIAEPMENGTISGNGGMVSWQGDSKIAYYKVEMTDGSWANPLHKFATSGTQVQIQGVQPGQYQLRVGAFSEVAGRWEYTRPIPVTVQ